MTISSIAASVRNTSYLAQYHVDKSAQNQASFMQAAETAQKQMKALAKGEAKSSVAYVTLGSTATFSQSASAVQKTQDEPITKVAKLDHVPMHGVFLQNAFAASSLAQEQTIPYENMSAQEQREFDAGMKQYKQVASYIHNPQLAQRSVLEGARYL